MNDANTDFAIVPHDLFDDGARIVAHRIRTGRIDLALSFLNCSGSRATAAAIIATAASRYLDETELRRFIVFVAQQTDATV